MSATPPSNLEGTHSPSPFEVLWDRYKSLIVIVVGAILVALVGQYALQRFDQQAIDESWSKFSVSIGLEGAYTDVAKFREPVNKALEGIEWSTLEGGLAGAEDAQKPYFHLAMARKAMIDEDWERAEAELQTLESKFAGHPLVTESKAPIQSRDRVETEGDEQPDEPEYEPAKEGSVVSLMREQIASAKRFQLPAGFQKAEIPADAKKVKLTFGDYGSATFAMMPQAPAHAAKFLELAQQDGGFWNGLAVDEIRRGTDIRKMPLSLHFGFASTKDDDRTKWTTTEPSEHLLDWEQSGLSHFEGAISARPEADGKSCADRIWVHVDDDAMQDGSRVVFGYVTDGMDVLRSICEAGMSAEDEDIGVGRPSENIRITSVEVL